MSDTLPVVEEFFDAYNAVDIERIGGLLSDDIVWGHRNRFSGHGKEALLSSIADWAAQAPGRTFGKAIRWAANGDLVFVEHQWFGRVAADDKVFGWKAGQEIAMDVTSLFVIRDGRIVEWSDYA